MNIPEIIAVSPTTLKQLSLPPANVRTDAETIKEYGRDWTKNYDVVSSAILFPETEAVKQTYLNVGLDNRCNGTHLIKSIVFIKNDFPVRYIPATDIMATLPCKSNSFIILS